jgi:hypothetical protein
MKGAALPLCHTPAWHAWVQLYLLILWYFLSHFSLMSAGQCSVLVVKNVNTVIRLPDVGFCDICLF